jgi:hypothetical protein
MPNWYCVPVIRGGRLLTLARASGVGAALGVAGQAVIGAAFAGAASGEC